MKPYIHAELDAKKYGGNYEDYLSIHQLMDISKSYFPDIRHRCLTHTSFSLMLFEKIFGEVFINSEGKTVSTKDIVEDHILSDYRGKFLPTPQDWLSLIPIRPWMLPENLEDYPPSCLNLDYRKETEDKRGKDLIVDGLLTNIIDNKTTNKKGLGGKSNSKSNVLID